MDKMRCFECGVEITLWESVDDVHSGRVWCSEKCCMKTDVKEREGSSR